MTLNQFYAKSERLFNKLSGSTKKGDDVSYCNAEEGFYFSNEGYTGYFVPDKKVLGILPQNEAHQLRGEAVKKYFYDALSRDSCEAKAIHGVRTSDGTRVVKLQNGSIWLYIQEAFLKGLPKDAHFLISKWKRSAPVLVEIADNAGDWQPVMIICPIFTRDENFKPDEETA